MENCILAYHWSFVLCYVIFYLTLYDVSKTGKKNGNMENIITQMFNDGHENVEING